MATMKTNEGQLFKMRITRYLKNGRRVTADTPGAKKIVKLSRKWCARIRDVKTGKLKIVPLNADKDVARHRQVDLEKKRKLVECGLADPFEETKDAPVLELLAAYLNDLREQGRKNGHCDNIERLAKKVIAACKAEKFSDLATEKVDEFLSKLTCSARTKNTYRGAIIALANFLVRKRKLQYNPFLLITRRRGEIKRKRRALTKELLQKLLDVAQSRPLVEALKIQRGERKGQLCAVLTPEYQSELEMRGRGRALLYVTAILTGLRFGTLSKMKVAYVHLGTVPGMLDIPGSIMKSGRDFRQPVRGDLVALLKSWINDTGKREDDLLFDAPPPTQMCRLLQKDLKMAGIPYQDAQGRYFDFHSFRKCAGSFLRQKKVDGALSMKHLDHSDIRQTFETYNDVELLDEQEALAAMPVFSLSGAKC
jgi:integrase